MCGSSYIHEPYEKESQFQKVDLVLLRPPPLLQSTLLAPMFKIYDKVSASSYCCAISSRDFVFDDDVEIG